MQNQSTTLRLLAAKLEADRWQRASENPLASAASRGTFIVQWVTRLNGRPIAARVSAAYYAPALRQRRTTEATANVGSMAGIPTYLIVDIGQRSVREAYRQADRKLAAPYSPFGQMVLSAVGKLRRFRWVADSNLAAPVSERSTNYATCLTCNRAAYAAGLGCQLGCARL